MLKACFFHWIDAVYFTVMTMTTVGYGVPYSLEVHEMWYMMVVQFFGLAIFSSITNEVFDFKKIQTVEHMVIHEKEELEQMLFYISRMLDNPNMIIARKNHNKKIGLSDDIFDDSLVYIEDSIRYSTTNNFKSSPFWD